MTTTLAFDVGKTGCRAALFDGGRRVAEVEVAGSVGIAAAGGVSAAAAAMTAAAAQLGVTAVDAIGAGLAGLGRAQNLAPQLAAAISERVGTGTVVLASDMTSSHAGALNGGPGIVVAAGTGTVALAIDATGRSAVCDGWGYLLGDDGSGYAIGRAGLASALRHQDGRGGSAGLHRLAEARFGPLDTLPSQVHGADNPARLVAAFSRDVLDAARDGDAAAAGIWTSAGRELARTAAAAARLFGPHEVDVAATGGLFGAGPLLTDPFDDELAIRLPQGRRRPCAGDALDGARLLTATTVLPHAAFTSRFRLGPHGEPGET